MEFLRMSSISETNRCNIHCSYVQNYVVKKKALRWHYFIICFNTVISNYSYRLLNLTTLTKPQMLHMFSVFSLPLFHFFCVFMSKLSYFLESLELRDPLLFQWVLTFVIPLRLPVSSCGGKVQAFCVSCYYKQ